MRKKKAQRQNRVAQLPEKFFRMPSRAHARARRRLALGRPRSPTRTIFRSRAAVAGFAEIRGGKKNLRHPRRAVADPSDANAAARRSLCVCCCRASWRRQGKKIAAHTHVCARSDTDTQTQRAGRLVGPARGLVFFVALAGGGRGAVFFRTTPGAATATGTAAAATAVETGAPTATGGAAVAAPGAPARGRAGGGT